MANEKLKSRLRIIVLIVIILQIDIVGGYFIGKKLIIPGIYKTYDTVEKMENSDSKGKKGGKEKPGLLKEIEPVNLNPANSTGEIFSCQLTLETKEREVIDELTIRSPQIKDIILTYFSFKSIQELNDVSKREEYRKELIDNINSVLTNGIISNLYVTQWILQFN